MIFTTPKTLDLFRQEYDGFGDSFVEAVSPPRLQELMDGMPSERCIAQSEIADVEALYFARSSLLGLFRRCRVYAAVAPAGEVAGEQFYEGSAISFARVEMEFYGATASTTLDDEVTHVLVHTSNLSCVHRIREELRDRYLKPHIVTENWIRDSIDCRKILPEAPYEPP